MKTKHITVLALLLASLLTMTVERGFSQSAESRVVRIAEIEVYPDHVDAYKAALKEEIAESIRTEPGVLTLLAVSLKGHPEQIRLFETYLNAAAYEAHLQSPHFTKSRPRKW